MGFSEDIHFSGKKIASKGGTLTQKFDLKKFSRTRSYYILLRSLICGEYKTANNVE